MKILYYVEEKDNLMYRWQEFHIYDELKQYGVEIEIFNYLSYSCTKNANDELLLRVMNKGVDLFMTPFNEEKLAISTLENIKKAGIPTLLICFDNLVIPFFHKKICKFFDLVWLTSSETEYLFKRWKANSVFLPYAANPSLFEPCKGDIEINELCFIGSPYGSRINMLNTLIGNGIKVSLFSNFRVNKKKSDVVASTPNLKSFVRSFLNLARFSYGRKVIFGALKNKLIKSSPLNVDKNLISMFPPVELKKLGDIYSSYALSLSSTAARNTGVLHKPLDIVNLRSFEIPMAGGIQICGYNKELASYFEEGKEIVFYHNEKDFIEKVNFYLLPENKALRDNMKSAARTRAINDHSWFARFKVVFDYFSLDYKKH